MECPEPMGYNPLPRALTWERLEKMRLKQLGLTNRYSRHLSEIIRMSQRNDLPNPGVQKSFELSGSYQGALQAMQEARPTKPASRKNSRGQDIKKNNSLAPFATLGKPTCGFFFSDGTNNRKAKFGIPPSDLVKWRNIPGNQ